MPEKIVQEVINERLVEVPDWRASPFDPTEATALEVSPILRLIESRGRANAVLTARLLAILRTMGQHIPQPLRGECYRKALHILRGND